ncbi:MAG: hypothetical protein IH933_11540 [Euryarchaeota archaeon]|nr:hypothetical protein [Euryarchaeota archaeon]
MTFRRDFARDGNRLRVELKPLDGHSYQVRVGDNTYEVQGWVLPDGRVRFRMDERTYEAVATRIGESSRTMFDRGVASIASRDVRLLVVMIGSILGLGIATLVLLAVLTSAVVLIRLAQARTALEAEEGPATGE